MSTAPDTSAAPPNGRRSRRKYLVGSHALGAAVLLSAQRLGRGTGDPTEPNAERFARRLATAEQRGTLVRRVCRLRGREIATTDVLRALTQLRAGQILPGAPGPLVKSCALTGAQIIRAIQQHGYVDADAPRVRGLLLEDICQILNMSRLNAYRICQKLWQAGLIRRGVVRVTNPKCMYGFPPSEIV